MAAVCMRCAGPMKYPQYRLCWRCFTDDKLKAARRDGYEAGYRDGKVDGRRQWNGHNSGQTDGPPGDLNEKRLRQLIQLCHPDRHGGSAASVSATQWLLARLNER